jgi:hypothetical protein
MDFGFTQQAMSACGQIERPQIAGFLRPALMAGTTMEELKKYTKSHSLVASKLVLSYSNAIGLIRK